MSQTAKVQGSTMDTSLEKWRLIYVLGICMDEKLKYMEIESIGA